MQQPAAHIYLLGGTPKWALAVLTGPPTAATISSMPASGSHAKELVAATSPGLDPDSRGWVERLRAGHPEQARTVAKLHEVLRRVALFELSRRLGQLYWISGPEFDDVAQQAADDALLKVLEKLDEFRGLSRFTTWAYKFVMFEVSAKVARHPWRRQAPGSRELALDHLSDALTVAPEDDLAQRAQLESLSDAIGQLPKRQREVFVAIALNEVPIDDLAAQLGTNRNAIYKNLFDARRSLRARLAAAGHPLPAR